MCFICEYTIMPYGDGKILNIGKIKIYDPYNMLFICIIRVGEDVMSTKKKFRYASMIGYAINLISNVILSYQ